VMSASACQVAVTAKEYKSVIAASYSQSRGLKRKPDSSPVLKTSLSLIPLNLAGVGSASLSRVVSMSAESCRREHMGSTVSARRRVGSASLSRVGSTAGAAATGAAQLASATRSVSAPAIR
jgi:hypothetical protein